MTCKCYFKWHESSYMSLWNHVTSQLTFAHERCCSASTCCSIMCYLIPELLFAQELRSHYDQQATPVIVTSYKNPSLHHAVNFFCHLWSRRYDSSCVSNTLPERKMGMVWCCINPLNAELNPICHLLILLGDLTFMVTCILSIFQDITNKMQR
jgi:hypothetical protein